MTNWILDGFNEWEINDKMKHLNMYRFMRKLHLS